MKQITITIDLDKIMPFVIVLAGILINTCLGVFALSNVSRQSSSAEGLTVAQANQILQPKPASELGTNKQYSNDGNKPSYIEEPENATSQAPAAPKDSERKPQSKKIEEQASIKEKTTKPKSTTNVSSTRESTASPIAKVTANSTTKREPWPEHVDANGDCLPASQQVDANSNFYPTCSSPIEGVNASNDGSIIYTYEDYEKTILGTCPSQRDKSSSWERGDRLNAIGIITSGESKTSPMNSLNALIEGWWNDYKLGKWTGRHMMASLNNVVGFDNTWANARIGFFIEWEGLFITWDNSWEDGKTINISDEQARYLNHLVSDGTNYLRWLDSTYNAKCPND